LKPSKIGCAWWLFRLGGFDDEQHSKTQKVSDQLQPRRYAPEIIGDDQ
jgi:hypothetical protein